MEMHSTSVMGIVEHVSLSAKNGFSADPIHSSHPLYTELYLIIKGQDWLAVITKILGDFLSFVSFMFFNFVRYYKSVLCSSA